MICIKCGVNIDNMNNAHEIFGNHIICDDCYQNNVFEKCDICGEDCFEDWLNTDEYFDIDTEEYEWNDICPACYKDNTLKYNHDYKPFPTFHSCGNGDRKHCLHIGIELELEGNTINNTRRFIGNVEDIFNDEYFYLKDDGSLNDKRGVEVISNPMMLPVAIKYWKKIFDLIKENDMCSTENCGLHFHLDKECLNQKQISNIDYICNMHPETIKRIGGRDIVGNNWAEQIIKNNNDWGRITDADGKYSAVNFCKNTIELRCFNSTDNWNNFYLSN